MTLELSEHAIDGRAIVELRGELDLSTAPSLRERLTEVLTGQMDSLILDLSGLEFMDSSGLNTLVDADRHARQHGGTLTLAAPQKIPAKVLRITGLDQHFAIYPTLADAITAATGASQAGPATAPA